MIEDFNSPNPPLREVALKKQIFEELLEQSSSVRTKEFVVRVKNPEFLTTLSAEQRLLAELSRKVMEQALRHVVDLFLEK